jgi:hypothetical protein
MKFGAVGNEYVVSGNLPRLTDRTAQYVQLRLIDSVSRLELQDQFFDHLNAPVTVSLILSAAK